MLGKCNNLVAEMKRNGISRDDLSGLCNNSTSTTDNKIRGKTDFTIAEAFLIQAEYFPRYDMKYLFSRS